MEKINSETINKMKRNEKIKEGENASKSPETISENENSFLTNEHERLAKDEFAIIGGELKQTQIRFHNCEKDGIFKGVFLGLGKKVHEWSTYLFFEPDTKTFVMIPAYAALEQINDNCEPGEWMCEITYIGKGENKKGQPVNRYEVKTGQLIKPFTNFNIEKLRSL